MSALLVFATEMERDGVFPNGIPKGYDCLITGVGILSVAFSISKAFQRQSYKDAIQIGIAGAYHSSGLQTGDIVEVKSDCLVEFLPWEPNIFFASGTLENVPITTKFVKGATVLNCTDTEEIGNIRGEFAQVETMEGAAFFAACKEYNVKATQIRAISNYASKYEKKEWKTEIALLKLKDFFGNYIHTLH
jgi:nucleoside phosphorylase